MSLNGGEEMSFRKIGKFLVIVSVLALTTIFVHTPDLAPTTALAAGTVPTPDHVVIVIEENHSYELLNNGFTFKGYAEDLPSVGSTVCNSGDYARKHAPWVNFTNVPSNLSKPFSYFPTSYSNLPTVSFVIPNLQHDMHDGTVGQADNWLENNLDGYAQWAKTHNSLLILTWDEDDHSENNQIPTIFVGEMVQPGNYGQHIDHFDVLRTIEDMYGLSYLGQSANGTSITNIWK
ncbi:MAG: phosphoesterase [Paenibacillaceae bacterium]|nr:phosphoesterase [Paenibacillaceae bacterium]